MAHNYSRINIWMSVRILDSLVSGILARPSGFSGISFDELDSHIDTMYISDGDEERSLHAQYRLVGIMDHVVQRVYSTRTVSVVAAEDLLRQLHRWSRCTPGILEPEFYPAHGQPRACLLASLGVACVFYFTVTLVVRPFYISTLSAHMERLEEDPAHRRLASTCVEYAILLLRMCLEAQEEGLLYTNMFIMK